MSPSSAMASTSRVEAGCDQHRRLGGFRSDGPQTRQLALSDGEADPVGLVPNARAHRCGKRAAAHCKQYLLSTRLGSDFDSLVQVCGSRSGEGHHHRVSEVIGGATMIPHQFAAVGHNRDDRPYSPATRRRSYKRAGTPTKAEYSPPVATEPRGSGMRGWKIW